MIRRRAVARSEWNLEAQSWIWRCISPLSGAEAVGDTVTRDEARQLRDA